MGGRPIDGTKNFVRGVPVWATLIALLVDDDPVLGVVQRPGPRAALVGGARPGAFGRSGGESPRPLRVSAVAELADASLSYASLSGWAGPRPVG